MIYKSPIPSLGSSKTENTRQLLSYIEDLKMETETKLTLMENTIRKLKSDITEMKEAMQ